MIAAAPAARAAARKTLWTQLLMGAPLVLLLGVAVASVAMTISTVSQPTVSSQEITEGSLLPRTPNAARPRIMVGTEPRLPATAMKPHSRNENTIPTSPAITPCQNETPKPSTKAP